MVDEAKCLEKGTRPLSGLVDCRAGGEFLLRIRPDYSILSEHIDVDAEFFDH
jgi:hypothetical protein